MRYMKKAQNKLTVKEFAERVGWSHDTVLRMVNAGKLKGEKKNPMAKNSPVLIPESELKKVVNVAA